MPTFSCNREARCILLDWGDTVMRVFPQYEGPMFEWPRVEAVDGIQEAFAKLQAYWTIALATNASDSEEPAIWSALARVGLDRFIDRVFCYRGVGHLLACCTHRSSQHSYGEECALNYPCRVTALANRKVRSIHLMNRRSVVPCMFF